MKKGDWVELKEKHVAEVVYVGFSAVLVKDVDTGKGGMVSKHSVKRVINTN